MSDRLPECAKECFATGTPCEQRQCRKWIEYEEDLNCCLVSIEEKGGPLTLMEAGERLGLSFVRVRQIEKMAIAKLAKRM